MTYRIYARIPAIAMSNYFKTAFSPQWASKEDGFFISNQPDISPIVFEVLLNLIYSGKFSVDNNENNEISFVDILIASDKLGFLEIYQHLEKRLLEHESAWKIPKDFITIFQFREDDRFAGLYEVAIGLVCRNAKVIFDSKEFLEMKEEHLIQLLNREIIGGYNPLDWRSMKENESIPHNNRDFYFDHKCKTSNSFIFSLSSLSNGVIPKLSQVKSKKEAIIWCKNKGPCFGLQDLWINRNLRSGKSKQKSYENKIIDSETFDIEEFEVFQIIDNRFSPLKLFKKACNFTGRIIKGTFQLTRRTIQSIIRFISNIERETYEKLFIGLSILGALALLAFIIYKFIMASFLTKILVVVIIAAITAIIIYICNKLDL
ncbi:unnamed protein product [Rhizophagus irregularis]|nr:unnamed protein product [Rhizophagus irregularis]